MRCLKHTTQRDLGPGDQGDMCVKVTLNDAFKLAFVLLFAALSCCADIQNTRRIIATRIYLDPMSTMSTALICAYDIYL